jgi:hypothetical protein
MQAKVLFRSVAQLVYDHVQAIYRGRVHEFQHIHTKNMSSFHRCVVLAAATRASNDAILQHKYAGMTITSLRDIQEPQIRL